MFFFDGGCGLIEKIRITLQVSERTKLTLPFFGADVYLRFFSICLNGSKVPNQLGAISTHSLYVDIICPCDLRREGIS